MFYFLDAIVPIINFALLVIGGYILVRLITTMQVSLYRLTKTEEKAETVHEKTIRMEEALKQALAAEQRVVDMEARIQVLYSEATTIAKATALANSRIRNVEDLQNQFKTACAELNNLQRVVRELQQERALARV